MVAIFDFAFASLTGNAPFPWQQALYEQFVAGREDNIPPSCNIPTGLGKSSVIAIWLIALANKPAHIPRRLVYVVNRRTVVDQTTTEVEKYLNALGKPELADLKKRLHDLCAIRHDTPLAISTLRGQFADNREWSADPARPAVICGTVDMIGSRLLFSGYGIGFKGKPLHAGFLGQDSLLVHDEAHLEPAFQDLLIAIQGEQKRSHEFRSFHVMELTATTRGENTSFSLSERDHAEPEVRKRIQAVKRIRLHQIEDEKKQLADKIAELAIQHKDSKQAVLVFLRSVEAVEKVAEVLRKAKQNVETLTGTMRGKERDGLVASPIFQRFLPKAVAADSTVFLVCTSAGEVGVNISADHLVCDLSTFESMAQRFGRVNRFGDLADTWIDIVHPAKFDEKEIEVRRERTLTLLRKLKGDGCPRALNDLDPKSRGEAFSPEPIILPVSDILFDVWALTTIREHLPGRPMVEPFLHGKSEWEPPQTYVAWRAEVGIINLDFATDADLPAFLEDYPLKPHELLRDRSDRVLKHLAALNEKWPGEPAWILDDDGTIERVTLEDMADRDNRDAINNRTVLLPPTVGGLQGGFLDAKSPVADDVADDWFMDEEKTIRRRVRVWRDEPLFEQKTQGMRLIRRVEVRADPNNEDEEPRFWEWFERPKAADDDGSKTALKAVRWDIHTKDVCENAELIVKALHLPENLQKAVTLAAKFHDLGKRRELWQRSIGNPYPGNPDHWLAKSGGRMKPLELSNFRHEFGSLLDAQEDEEFKKLEEDTQDIVLHLIATHHGFGRPHFDNERAFDPEPRGRDTAKAALEVLLRFARLQRKFGRWGLAYLESLLRAADYQASAFPSKVVGDKP